GPAPRRRPRRAHRCGASGVGRARSSARLRFGSILRDRRPVSGGLAPDDWSVLAWSMPPPRADMNPSRRALPLAVRADLAIEECRLQRALVMAPGLERRHRDVRARARRLAQGAPGVSGRQAAG